MSALSRNKSFSDDVAKRPRIGSRDSDSWTKYVQFGAWATIKSTHNWYQCDGIDVELERQTCRDNRMIGMNILRHGLDDLKDLVPLLPISKKQKCSLLSLAENIFSVQVVRLNFDG